MNSNCGIPSPLSLLLLGEGKARKLAIQNDSAECGIVMIRFLIFFALVLIASIGCAPHPAPRSVDAKPRVVSLDFCADQFVLKLVDRKQIAALSPDAEKLFSYLRDEAKGLPKVRPRAEDILLHRPDIVVRSYGGGPRATEFLERAGIKVVQVPYANDIAAARQSIVDVSRSLDVPGRGESVAAEMDARLAALPENEASPSVLYMTSKGAVAGTGTSIDDILTRAGAENFQTASGWGGLPLERLAYERPDMIAAGFFETSDLVSDIWSPARHPLARRRLAQLPGVDIPGAWTACGGWFNVNAVEALAKGIARYEEAGP